MKFNKKSPVRIVLITLIFSFSTFALVYGKSNDSGTKIGIKNFGQMNERFYRGARPKDKDLQALAAMGVKTIIDLTDNSMEYEKPAVEALGMRYVNIPMVDKGYPKIEQINEFLKVVDDPATGNFFVHCAGGRHRTGVVAAVYRFIHDGWNLDQVTAEMKHYDFDSGFGHGKQKDFVKDYWQKFQARQSGNATSAAAGSN